MDIQKLLREFRYNGVVLVDPNETFTLVQVRDFYATVYPEILSADIEGPQQIAAKAIYTFRRAVGTKGGANLADMIRDLAELLHANWFGAGDSEFIKDLQEALHKNEVALIPVDASLRLIALHRQHCEAKAA